MTAIGMYCRKRGYDLWRRQRRRGPMRWTRRVMAMALALTLVLGGVWGWCFRTWVTEQGAVEELRAVNVASTPLGGPKLRGTLGRLGWVLDRVTLIVPPPSMTDSQLAPVRELKDLHSLDLGFTQVSDAGLEYLKHLRRLQWLGLVGTHVTDAGLKQLDGLKQLKMLDLEGTQVTPVGLASIKRALPNCSIAY